MYSRGRQVVRTPLHQRRSGRTSFRSLRIAGHPGKSPRLQTCGRLFEGYDGTKKMT